MESLRYSFDQPSTIKTPPVMAYLVSTNTFTHFPLVIHYHMHLHMLTLLRAAISLWVPRFKYFFNLLAPSHLRRTSLCNLHSYNHSIENHSKLYVAPPLLIATDVGAEYTTFTPPSHLHDGQHCIRRDSGRNLRLDSGQ